MLLFVLTLRCLLDELLLCWFECSKWPQVLDLENNWRKATRINTGIAHTFDSPSPKIAQILDWHWIRHNDTCDIVIEHAHILYNNFFLHTDSSVLRSVGLAAKLNRFKEIRRNQTDQ